MIAEAILRQIRRAGQPYVIKEKTTMPTEEEPLNLPGLGLLLYMMMTQDKGTKIPGAYPPTGFGGLDISSFFGGGQPPGPIGTGTRGFGDIGLSGLGSMSPVDILNLVTSGMGGAGGVGGW